jgi:hypothetical protein
MGGSLQGWRDRFSALTLSTAPDRATGPQPGLSRLAATGSFFGNTDIFGGSYADPPPHSPSA